jgi:chemotaxis protein MotB
MAMRRQHHEEPVNHEAWAIPYGDLITLLLALFVVMYAMSSLNEGKYRLLSDALNAEFRGPPRSPEPIQVGEKDRGVSPNDSLVDTRTPRRSPSEKIAESSASSEAQDTKDPAKDRSINGVADPLRPPTTPAEDVTGNAQELNKVAADVEQAMDKLIREKMVTVRRHGLWIEVEIQTDILFPSGIAALSPLAVSVLAPLADSIKPFPNPIRVEGHTDNVPINKRGFLSNWELSSARAASVVHLFSERGIAPTRLTVIGLGEYRPIKSNATPEGRSANRRVVLVILGSNGLPDGVYGNEKRSSENQSNAVVVPAIVSSPGSAVP